MCDTFCVAGAGGMLFAKSSDRPPGEAQVVEAHPSRPPGGRVRTQYLEIADRGARPTVGSRPTWLWGFEHGVNDARVAIGNEKIWTTRDPRSAPPALIGMDLVRLALERAGDAEEALAVLTELLELHGQGGSCESDRDEPYWSSFLIADPTGAWVVETSGRSWVARREPTGAAISNRVVLDRRWDRASADVAAGTDVQSWRDPQAPTAVADLRLAATRPFVTAGRADPRAAAATLRHHGTRPWGAPGGDPTDVCPPPAGIDPDWRGITVCMHVRGYQATTAAMIADLAADGDAPQRAWVALGSPCASVFVPIFPPRIPDPLTREETWWRFAALRDRVESDPDAPAEVRAVLGPVEADLWDAADEAADGDDGARVRYTTGAWAGVADALRRLGV